MFGLDEAVQQMVEALADDDARTCIRGELNDRMALLRRLKGATAAYESSLIRAIDALDDGGLDGAGVARVAGGMSSRVAGQVAKAAEVMEEMPAALDALSEGRITAEHASTLAKAAEKTSTEQVEGSLLSLAEDVPADVFAKRSARWVHQQRECDDAARVLARQRWQRELRSWVDDDGMHVWRLALDPVAAAAVRSVFDERYEQLWRDDGGREGSPSEVRTPGQRSADAFVELVTSTAPDRPPHPRNQITAVVEVSRLRADDPTGFAELLDGQPLPQAVLERLGCDASLNLVLAERGRPLWLGRDHRTASIAQWKAPVVRDRGCVGCGAAPDRCEAHHIEPWAVGGTTDVDNLVLLCSRCHHDVHDRGAKVIPDGDVGYRLEYPGRPPPTGAAWGP